MIKTKLSKQELESILEKHQLFIQDKPGGVQANLRYIDLSGVDLAKVDLRFSNLAYEDLRNAYYRKAYLTQ